MANKMGTVLEISRALSDENRVRALMALRRGELCACQVMELLSLAPSTTSKHMSILQRAGLVAARKDGRWTYYQLSGSEAPLPAQKAFAWLEEFMSEETRILEDSERVERIRSLPREDLCRTRRTKR